MIPVIKIGKLIKELRESIPLSAGELARQTGIHRSYISKLENKSLLPSPDIFIKILVKLNPPFKDAYALKKEYIKKKYPKLYEMEEIFYEEIQRHYEDAMDDQQADLYADRHYQELLDQKRGK